MRSSYATQCPDCQEEIVVRPDFACRHLGKSITSHECHRCRSVHYWSAEGRVLMLADEIEERRLMEVMEHDAPTE